MTRDELHRQYQNADAFMNRARLDVKRTGTAQARMLYNRAVSVFNNGVNAERQGHIETAASEFAAAERRAREVIALCEAA